MEILVETEAGLRGGRSPRRIHMRGRAVDVAEVLDRWAGADHCYFKVRGEDGNLYILRRDEAGRLWELTMFKTPQGETLIVAPPPKGTRKPTPH